MDSIGPKRDTGLYMDMHADDNLCWRYTAVMVIVQLLAFGRVQDNRVHRRERREAKRAERLERVEKERAVKLERERSLKLKEEKERMHVVSKINGKACTGSDGVVEEVPAWEEKLRGNRGLVIDEIVFSNGDAIANRKEKAEISESEESLTETSEEEMIV